MGRRELIRRWKAFNRRLFRGVQVVLLFVSLALLYYVGFTLTRLLVILLPRRMLGRRPRMAAPGGSRWLRAEGYGLGPEDLRRQS